MSRPRLSDLIGALELGTGPIVVGDAALETVAGVPRNTTVFAPCACIGDGALEATPGPRPNPTFPRPYGSCIGDGALEMAAGSTAAGPTAGGCRTRTILAGLCIGDNALEAAAGPSRNPTMPHPFGPCIGDGALEAAAGIMAARPTQGGVCYPTVMCRSPERRADR